MEAMEDSIGGGHKGLLYNMAEYELVARKFDAETQAALDAMEESMKVSGGTARERAGPPSAGAGGMQAGSALNVILQRDRNTFVCSGEVSSSIACSFPPTCLLLAHQSFHHFLPSQAAEHQGSKGEIAPAAAAVAVMAG